MFQTRIYNKSDFINEFQNNSSSDDELLFLLVKKYGPDVLARVDGDFSGSVEINGELVLFRDHLGINSIYYYLKDNRFEYSDSLESLMSIDGLDVSVNDEYLFKELTGRNTLSNEETIFQYIKCVPPGCWMRVIRLENSFNTEIHQYWSLGKSKIRFKTEDEYCNAFRKLIEDAVRIRMEYAGNNVGSELSGGLDSSVIAILLSRLGANVSCVSWSAPFEETAAVDNDERLIIEDICKQERFKCHFLTKEDKLEESYYSNLPPYANTLPISRTSQYLSKNGIKYIFSGHGGDEGVSRRCSIYELWYKREYNYFFRCMYERSKGKNFRILRTLKYVAEYLHLVSKEKSNAWHNTGNSSEEYLNKNFVDRVNVNNTPVYFKYDAIKYINQGGLRPRLENLYYQAQNFDVHYLLPYLDYRVIDFATSIPRHLFKNDKGDRYIFKVMFTDIMPESLKAVNYKDIPSMQNKKQNVSDNTKFETWLDPLIAYLDVAIWDKYWDFDKLKELRTVEYYKLSSEERHKLFMLLNNLGTCKLIQNYQMKNNHN